MSIETYGQRYRIRWSSHTQRGDLIDNGSVIVRVSKPRIVEYIIYKAKLKTPMNIRAQAQQTADGYLRREKDTYRKSYSQTLAIEPIKD